MWNILAFSLDWQVRQLPCHLEPDEQTLEVTQLPWDLTHKQT